MLNLYFGKKIVGINPFKYIKETTIPVVLPMIMATASVFPIYYFMNEGWLRLALFFSSFVLLFTALFLIIGLSKDERHRLMDMILKPLISRLTK